MNTLKTGSTGEDVVALQEMLRQAGYFKHPTNTGYFGDITANALKQYQTANGLPATGIYDSSIGTNASQAKEKQDFLNLSKGTIYEDIFSQMATEHPEMLSQAMKSINNPLNQGTFIGGGTVLSPTQLANYEKMIASEVDPYYQDKTNYDKSIYENTLGSQGEQAGYSIQDLLDSAQQEYNTSEDSFANNGSWLSSARAQAQDTIQAKYNRKLKEQSDSQFRQMNQLNQGREYNYGAGSFDTTPVANYGVSFNPSGTASKNLLGTQSYSPFGQNKGLVQTQQYATKKARANELITTQYPNVFKNF